MNLNTTAIKAKITQTQSRSFGHLTTIVSISHPTWIAMLSTVQFDTFAPCAMRTCIHMYQYMSYLLGCMYACAYSGIYVVALASQPLAVVGMKPIISMVFCCLAFSRIYVNKNATVLKPSFASVLDFLTQYFILFPK